WGEHLYSDRHTDHHLDPDPDLESYCYPFPDPHAHKRQWLHFYYDLYYHEHFYSHQFLYPDKHTFNTDPDPHFHAHKYIRRDSADAYRDTLDDRKFFSKRFSGGCLGYDLCLC